MTEYSRSSSYPCGWGLFLFPCAPIAPHFPPPAGMPPRPIAIPRPNPRDPLGNSGISPYGGASLLQSLICTATAGVALLTRQKCPKATWGKPQDPDAPERPPGKPKGGFPERRLNGAYKVPQAHLPPPNLPRFGGGERPPFLCKPPAPLTITMGQRPVDTIACKSESIYFLSP